ncbi:zinc metalloproteinase-disintegrin-like berythractivase [Scophthalmus maximus]|uniref:zinc metalloproteinase-disintegrin-like berythractivase n=1 Tax=Scophthalmus maximus TaxID=52904 RepID=UPI001FA91C26|nr:zinc metalloproteinase-disintegrin-like berythractivase [Scophthalmus maximus]
MLSLWLTWVCLVQSSSGLLAHVERYELVRPRRLQARQRRSLTENQLYPDALLYELTFDGRNHSIHLEKNSDLIGRGYTETRYSEDGTRVTTSPSEDHCYYHGHVEGDTDSSVSVGICSGISGFVRARQQLYLIEPLGRSDEGDHAVYRHEHLKTSSSNTTVLFDRERDRDQDRDQDRGPRLAGLFRSRPWKTSPVTQKFVELFVVVDNTEYKQYGSDTKSRIFGVINHVDKLYRPLNIRVLLVGLEIWTHRDFIDVDINSETTLDNFLLWRQADLQRMTKHDNAQFVTGKDFDGDTVGLANKFAMCGENSGGVNQDHHHNLIGLAATIAHEMGHNLGLSHDAAGCVCGPSRSSGNCVMAEKLRTGSEAFPEFFSSCSVQQLAEFMERAQPSCLDKPRGVRTIAVGPRCGNALLDPGEECDCGTVEECKNLCCDASTCRLTEGSQCAHGQCCDNCQFQSAGSVCRKSAGDCDLPEYCTGESEDCPDDGFEMNGKPCYDQSQGFCHDGQCPTHEQHCWRLFGLGAIVGPDLCFDLNSRGEQGANCGKNKFHYIPCAAQNLKCGSIFCQGGGESITGKRAAYTVRGNTECKLVVDDYNTRNFDMVPKGTRCGPNKVCLDHRCMDVSVYGKREDCAKKCSDKGVCNHKNECHCHPGWAPPYCDIQYADIPQGQKGIITGVCAALAVLLLVTAVIAGLMCCKKDNMDNYTSKRKVHSAPDKLNPMYQEASVKERPQISSPTLMESTATQACAPLTVAMAPSRTAPQPPKKMSPASSAPQTEPTKPQPPAKPLPPLNKPQSKAAKPNPPPVPPVKPSPPPAVRVKPCAPPPPPAKPRDHRPT